MASLTQCVRACRSAKRPHVYVRYAEELATQVRPLLLDYIRTRCHPDSVEDVLQETLVAIAEGACDCQGKSNAAVWGWCYTIARRKISQEIEKTKQLRQSLWPPEALSELMEATQTSRTLSPREKLEIKETMALFDKLNPKTRELIWLRQVQQWDFESIGEVMGMSPDAVRMAVVRGTRQLQRLLSKPEARI